MKLLLISGPNTADTMAAGLRLMKRGYAVYYAQPLRINLSNYGPILHNLIDQTEWRMKWNLNDVEMVKRCDGVYMCHGWGTESLCKVHMNLAKNINKQVFFENVAEPRD